jgi:5'-methylthioadenosine phosphorylase
MCRLGSGRGTRPAPDPVFRWEDVGMSPHRDAATPIGVIGGSGLYALIDDKSATKVTVETPFGPTSSEITVGTFAGRSVAFLPRHGTGHTVAPHRINYRANIWALASLGVQALVTSSAVGGLNPALPSGTFVLPDQIMDRTNGRADTYYDSDASAQHVTFDEPYCPELRRFAAASLSIAGEPFVARGTTMVIQGPRFSTRAEAHWFRSAGADIINMTQYPEVALAAELNLGVVNLSFVTDNDSDGAPSDQAKPEALSTQLVMDRMAAAQPRLLAMIGAIVAGIPDGYSPRQLVPPGAAATVLAAKPKLG